MVSSTLALRYRWSDGGADLCGLGATDEDGGCGYLPSGAGVVGDGEGGES